MALQTRWVFQVRENQDVSSTTTRCLVLEQADFVSDLVMHASLIAWQSLATPERVIDGFRCSVEDRGRRG